MIKVKVAKVKATSRQPVNTDKDAKSNKLRQKILHGRNLHGQAYPMEKLAENYSALSRFLITKPDGEQTIRFSDPEAVKALNAALLDYYYQIKFWDIPAGYLCPPIPGRADYVHYIADLLASSNQENIPKGKHIKGLDIGTGANLVYPILANRSYGWTMVGTDIDAVAVKSAKTIIDTNSNIKADISLRQQEQANDIFNGVVQKDDYFDFCMCNPPFHKSAKEAQVGSQRKVKNLQRHSHKRQSSISAPNKTSQVAQLNFAGQANELWCQGGELAFIQRMLEQSMQFKAQIGWFTCLVSRKEHLAPITNSLAYHKVPEYKIIDMAQGQKISRFVAWRF